MGPQPSPKGRPGLLHSSLRNRLKTDKSRAKVIKMGDLERRMSAQASITRVYGVTKATTFVDLDKHALAVYAKLLDDYWKSARGAHDNLITGQECTDELAKAHDEALGKIEKSYLRASAAINGRMSNIEE